MMQKHTGGQGVKSLIEANVVVSASINLVRYLGLRHQTI